MSTATFLGAVAWLLAGVTIFMSGWAAICFLVPQMMTIALGWAGVTLLFGAGQAMYLHHYLALWFSCAGLVVVAAVMWRSWPDGWNPWHTLRDFAESARLSRG